MQLANSQLIKLLDVVANIDWFKTTVKIEFLKAPRLPQVWQLL